MRITNIIKAATIILTFSMIGCNSKVEPTKPQARPNIVLIVADDLGFSDLGCYGSEIKTPNLDQLAKMGIKNTAFYTSPTCSPTRAMLLSGVVNHRNGYGTMEGDWAPNQVNKRGYEGHLNFDVVPFPQLLQDNGYMTSLTGKWHQAFPANDTTLWPQKRGFDRSFSLIQGGAGHFSDQQKMFSFFERSLYTENGKVIDSLPTDFYSSDYYTQKAIEYIEESVQMQKPFFSMITYTSPHWPLQVPDEYIDLYKGRYDAGYEAITKQRLAKQKQLGIIPDSTQLPKLTPNVIPWAELSDEEQKRSARTMEIYAAMVERMDANVGKLMAHLKTTAQFENTLFIFMADNGAEGNSINGIVDTGAWVAENFDNSYENMGRRNSYIFTGPAWAQVSTLPFKWYKSFATEGGVRCPMIIVPPKNTSIANTINQDFISVMDLAPTILEYAGVAHPDTVYQGKTIFPMDGLSLHGWLQGTEANTPGKNVAHCWELYGRIGVRKGDWKAEYYDTPYGAGTWELYNIAKDLSEEHNLANENTEIIAELKNEWEAYVKKYKVIIPNEKVAYGVDEVWIER